MKTPIARWSALLALAVGFTAGTSVVSAFEGRWKVVEDGSCYWDDADSGPDQCAPGAPIGRWKIGGDNSCVWDPEDAGPHQCAPPYLAPEPGTAPLEDAVASVPSSTPVPAAAEGRVQVAPTPAVIPGS
jgi:hypothetical protein